MVARAKFRMDSSKLYMPITTPEPVKSATFISIGLLPSFGTYVMVTVPSPGTRKSVALY